MRKLLGFTGLLAVLLLALMASPVSAGSPVLTVATGSYTLLGGHGANRTQSFTVQQSSDGTVMGQLQLNTFGGNIITGTVNCFTREGNQAIVGGTFTEFSQDPSQVGTSFAFAIQDNPDVSTFVYFQLPDPYAPGCDQLLGYTQEQDLNSLLQDQGVPISKGNILIAPH
jgi:hypothetical protein